MDQYTITATSPNEHIYNGHQWTRDRLQGAKGLANNIAKRLKLTATVTYSFDGQVVYVATPDPVST
jgi:hypothetical protein